MFRQNQINHSKSNKMAQLFAASIYGANGDDWNKSFGVSMAFNPTTVVVRSLNQPTAYSGVTCNSQIQLLPTAPSPIQPVYYTPLTVAQIITAANA